MNGWKEGALQKIINECPIEGEQTDYNPLAIVMGQISSHQMRMPLEVLAIQMSEISFLMKLLM